MRPSALVLSSGHPTAPSRIWVSQKVLEQPLINTDLLFWMELSKMVVLVKFHIYCLI